MNTEILSAIKIYTLYDAENCQKEEESCSKCDKLQHACRNVPDRVGPLPICTACNALMNLTQNYKQS